MEISTRNEHWDEVCVLPLESSGGGGHFSVESTAWKDVRHRLTSRHRRSRLPRRGVVKDSPSRHEEVLAATPRLNQSDSLKSLLLPRVKYLLDRRCTIDEFLHLFVKNIKLILLLFVL